MPLINIKARLWSAHFIYLFIASYWNAVLTISGSLTFFQRRNLFKIRFLFMF